MPSNCGTTTLKRRRRNENQMAEFDKLPKELREWVAGAVLPWRAKSVKSAFLKAKKQTGSAKQAMDELEKRQKTLVAKDVCKVWAVNHPEANQ